MKPTLDLYLREYVDSIYRPEDAEPWQWAIRLANGVYIINKDRRETFVPDEIVGKQLKTISYSFHDTTITFSGGLKWSLNPTQYALHDPAHGGEVYPQWPEELEEAGIPSHPEEEVSAQPQEGWDKHRQGLLRKHEERVTQEANDWLQEDAEENS